MRFFMQHPSEICRSDLVSMLGILTLPALKFRSIAIARLFPEIGFCDPFSGFDTHLFNIGVNRSAMVVGMSERAGSASFRLCRTVSFLNDAAVCLRGDLV